MNKYICSNCKEIIGTDKDKIENFLLNILGGGLTIISVIIYLALLIVSIILIFTQFWILGLVLTILCCCKRFSFKTKQFTNQCPKCRAENTLVPSDTLKGQELIRENTK
ncbi:MAG: hypothetical protein NC191_09645 [Muribaculaceae bacterium]|nr:hypothetical protein [Muribaculaceae bacterium]